VLVMLRCALALILVLAGAKEVKDQLMTDEQLQHAHDHPNELVAGGAFASAADEAIKSDKELALMKDSGEDERRQAFLESQDKTGDDKIKHLLSVGDGHYQSWKKAGPHTNKAGVSIYQSSLAHGEAFNVDDKNKLLINEDMADRLLSMFWGSELMSADTIEGIGAVSNTQKSLLSMVQRIADVSFAKGDKELAKKYWLKLMHLYFEKHAGTWRLFKKKLVNAGLLDKSYTRPDLMEAKTEL